MKWISKYIVQVLYMMVTSNDGCVMFHESNIIQDVFHTNFLKVWGEVWLRCFTWNAIMFVVFDRCR